MNMWDRKHNIPTTITRQETQKDGAVKEYKVDNPEEADREIAEAIKPIRAVVDSYLNTDDDG